MSLNGSEILIIAVLALLLLGPDKLPGALRTFGRAMGEVRKYQNLAKSEIDKAIASAEIIVDSESSEETEKEVKVENKIDETRRPKASPKQNENFIEPILDEDER